jgi:hypothetical protein
VQPQSTNITSITFSDHSTTSVHYFHFLSRLGQKTSLGTDSYAKGQLEKQIFHTVIYPALSVLKMVKRSREDSDPSSPESQETVQTPSSQKSVNKPDSVEKVTGSAKFIHLDPESGVASEMLCSLPPHRQTLSFASYEEYEVHYNKTHVNRCLECRKNFPTTHFLNLHIEENHDALVSVKKERGEKTVSTSSNPTNIISNRRFLIIVFLLR